MNHKIIKICGISIHCEVILEMQTVNSEKVLFYNCAKNVEVKMVDVTSIFFIFIAKRVENELIFKYPWE